MNKPSDYSHFIKKNGNFAWLLIEDFTNFSLKIFSNISWRQVITQKLRKEKNISF